MKVVNPFEQESKVETGRCGRQLEPPPTRSSSSRVVDEDGYAQSQRNSHILTPLHVPCRNAYLHWRLGAAARVWLRSTGGIGNYEYNTLHIFCMFLIIQLQHLRNRVYDHLLKPNILAQIKLSKCGSCINVVMVSLTKFQRGPPAMQRAGRRFTF